jgi:alkanesulfonate monooxygenase SsuD/methylene tetrahydromethanopterin reductase-like flavin-dependent oxidoreductase (luciferase family)
MKFSTFHLFHQHAGMSAKEVYDYQIQVVELLEELGFDGVWVAEHHFREYGQVNNIFTMLANLAARTEKLRLGTGIVVLPLHNPIHVAEEAAMVDLLSEGRLELGIGRGISPYEVGYYGVDPATGPERFAEAMQVILKGLTEKRLDQAGKYFTFKDVPMEMQPVQRPHPPLWYGANSLESADRLAKQACNTVVGMKAEGVGQFAARYRAAWKALGRSEAEMPLIGLSRHIVVGDTDKEAQSAAKRAFLLWYDALIHLWRAHGVGLPRQLIPEKFEDALAQGYIIAGSASTVRERMKRDNEIAGINYSLCRLAFGDLSFEESKRSLELFAKEVMPAV